MVLLFAAFLSFGLPYLGLLCLGLNWLTERSAAVLFGAVVFGYGRPTFGLDLQTCGL